MDTVQEENSPPCSPLPLLQERQPFLLPPTITLSPNNDLSSASTHSLPSQTAYRTDSISPRRKDDYSSLAINGGHRKEEFPSTSAHRSNDIFVQRSDLHFPPGYLDYLSNSKDERHLSIPGRESEQESPMNSRRPSAIIAALRRPSQAIALSAAQAVMNQRRYILGLFNGKSEGSIGKRCELDSKEVARRRHNRKLGDDSLTVILSALYAKLLVVLGMAFPITEIISSEVQPFFYQGFYLYLYIGSIAFVTFMYASLMREKAVVEMINSYSTEKQVIRKKLHKIAPKYGSFYLRLGAIAFGIGSMVYSGLEFGKYFESKDNPHCESNILQAFTPATRMLLTLVQVQFIFLNSKDVEFNKHRIIARFGLMHMIATNLCEWLYVLVEETKHEIIHLAEHHNSTKSVFHEKYCQEGRVMGHLVTNASPFLFPCTIEYSLICAVILFEIWKKVKMEEKEKDTGKERSNYKINNDMDRVTTHFHFNPFGGRVVNSNHHFTVDCSNAHRGLFAGIMVIVLTIISLIMFFVLTNTVYSVESSQKMAMFEVSMVELLLYVITTVAVIIAMVKLRGLKYERKYGAAGHTGIGLDNTLLVVAQTGMFIYCMFSIIGSYFTMESQNIIALSAEIFSFIQTCLQTMFVLDGWWRRCRNMEQTKSKPGREIITFLIVANMAMWTINTLEKNRAEFRPTHLLFFGDWAWTIITHISMPMAIFYRQRMHSSLPALDTHSFPTLEPKHVPQRRKRWRRRGDEELAFIVSAFYAKILIILGIALPVTDAIATNGFHSYDVFYIYMYSGSILFLIYMYIIHLKEKSMQESWRHSQLIKRNSSSDSFNIKRKSYNRYGSFYFRMGVTGFGMGTVVYSALQWGQYWEVSSEDGCDDILKAIKPVMRIVFVLLQMLFIFSYSNFLDVQKSKLIAKFGLMHMIATNVCEWFFVLVEETQYDIYVSAKIRLQHFGGNQSLSDMDHVFINSKTLQITLKFYDNKFTCLKSDIMQPVLVKTGPYLAPCTVEYNLLCAVILVLIWKNNCTITKKENSKDLSAEISRQSGSNLIYSRSQSQFSVDCAQVHKGLFSGLLVLAVTIISLIMFFELVSHEDREDIAILQVNIWEAVLFWTGTIAVIFCIASIRDVDLSVKKKGLELEHLLLIVTQWGIFMYFLFQIIGGVLMGTNKGTGGIMRIITPLSALVQSSCQTVLILDAWRRRCSTEAQVREKPGRQLVTFLLVINISLWVVNRLKNNRSVSHPNQMDFYGVLAWNIITHVSMPLVVSYRFQSTVCFYEIWKHVYKMRHVKLDNIGNDQHL